MDLQYLRSSSILRRNWVAGLLSVDLFASSDGHSGLVFLLAVETYRTVTRRNRVRSAWGAGKQHKMEKKHIFVPKCIQSENCILLKVRSAWGAGKQHKMEKKHIFVPKCIQSENCILLSVLEYISFLTGVKWVSQVVDPYGPYRWNKPFSIRHDRKSASR